MIINDTEESQIYIGENSSEYLMKCENLWRIYDLNKPLKSLTVYKLKELDEKFKIIKNNLNILDVGSAPGSWTQYLSEKSKGSKIMSIDLKEVEKIKDVYHVVGDFLDNKNQKVITDYFPKKIDNLDIEKIRNIDKFTFNKLRCVTLSICYNKKENPNLEIENILQSICIEAESVINSDACNIIILSDREVDQNNIAIPALLATSSVHHHLIKKGLRTKVGLIIETGEARRVHDLCLLAGYGAEAINPYLAFYTLSNIIKNHNQANLNISTDNNYEIVLDDYYKKTAFKIISKSSIV